MRPWLMREHWLSSVSLQDAVFCLDGWSGLPRKPSPSSTIRLIERETAPIGSRYPAVHTCLCGFKAYSLTGGCCCGSVASFLSPRVGA